ncbi:MAG: RagB/SusD family nutrient uptake outer membrane protein [Lentimicrobiaceae bacterium]|nr:RagB/SusD family nutrient uptake outer membrane protein [Lentimicrobiaceae bacterium]
MKTNIKLGLLSVVMLGLGLSACDYLDNPVRNESITEDFIWTQRDRIKGVSSIAYTYLNRDMYNPIDGGGAMMSQACDEAVNSNSNSWVRTFTNGVWSPNVTMDDIYSNMYTGIRYCNYAFENLDKGKAYILPINATYINVDSTIVRYKAENYFLRAYFYSELIKRFGGVPIVTNVMNLTDDLNLPRNSVDEVVTQIVQDCDKAARSLPKTMRNWMDANESKERGRVGQSSALALKSRVLLLAASPLWNTTGDVAKWQRAADASLACIQFAEANASNMDLMTWTDLTGDKLFNATNWETNGPKEALLWGYPTSRNDIELNNAPVSYSGALGRCNPSQELVDAFEMKTTGLPITDPASNFNPLSPYANRDPRLTLDILYNGNTFKSVSVDTYAADAAGLPGKDGIGKNVNATRTGYYMSKFLNSSVVWNSSSNVSRRRAPILMRYAEVLLNYAEALNEAQGPVADVYKYMNKVRTRAQMPNLPAGLTKDQMRTRIQNERRVEFCFEEMRFFDVRRWKLGATYFNKPITGVKITVDAAKKPVSFEKFEVEKRKWDEKMNLYPISQNQLYRASKLVQNPGW